MRKAPYSTCRPKRLSMKPITHKGDVAIIARLLWENKEDFQVYIKETTAKERLIIAGAVGDAFCNLERAHRMLYRVWEDHFGDREQKDISAYDAKDMGDLLYTIDDIIFEALLEYALLTCDTSFPGLEPHMKGAAQAVKSMRVHDLNDAIFKVERRMKSRVKSDEICHKRADILKLPDDQAALALEALLKEAEAEK